VTEVYCISPSNRKNQEKEDGYYQEHQSMIDYVARRDIASVLTGMQKCDNVNKGK
jgi:hypothetical protein